MTELMLAREESSGTSSVVTSSIFLTNLLLMIHHIAFNNFTSSSNFLLPVSSRHLSSTTSDAHICGSFFLSIILLSLSSRYPFSSLMRTVFCYHLEIKRRMNNHKWKGKKGSCRLLAAFGIRQNPYSRYLFCALEGILMLRNTCLA